MFFNRVPRIEYVDQRRVHIFECAAAHCRGKNGRDVRRFLDKGDAKSTSGLRRHAKMCWGDDAVIAADNTKDLEGARAIIANSGVKRNGSITAAFERIGKEKVSYSHRQYTYTETRQVIYLPAHQSLTCYMLQPIQGRNRPLDCRGEASLRHCEGSRVRGPDENRPPHVSTAFASDRCSRREACVRQHAIHDSSKAEGAYFFSRSPWGDTEITRHTMVA